MDNQKTLVLLSMLHWGFGHVTRCFPLIHTLLKLKKSILIVCTSSQKLLLTSHFEGLQFYIVSDNMPKYGKTKLETLIRLSLLAPIHFRKIKKEQQLVAQLAQNHNIELIISDNKYGFYHPNIPSIILTHQLNIQSGWGSFFDSIINRLNNKLLTKFNQVWVIDNEGSMSLAGKLSARNHRNTELFQKYKWIGLFNRLQTLPAKGSNNLLIILSGPEPQRTILEEKIIQQLPDNAEHITLIRGTSKTLSNLAQQTVASKNFTNIIDLASLSEIENLLSQTEYVLGRAGYTSLMEWVCGGWKSIVIPTPGQAEQEYLGKYLTEKKWVMQVSQNDFDLSSAIKNAAVFDYDSNRPTAAGSSEIHDFIASALS